MRRLLFILLLFCIGLHAWCQETIHIWDGTGQGSDKVTLAEYLPVEPVETAIIVCPGGSYFWLDYETEGDSVARSLRKQGIAAYVLKYRTGGVFPFITHSRLVVSGHHYPMPLNDLQQAIRIVRQKQYKRVGVMGFSAGGHLALSVALFGKGEVRPDFIAPCYPVVTMSHPCVHKRSRRGLLGEYQKSSQKMRDSLSLEKHVTSDCPPVFLMNCVDDPIVDYRNSVLMDSALTAHQVPHLYIQNKTGGHGFGTTWSKTSEEASGWFDAFLKWLRTI
jgi:acetyl esterase/lipase